MAHSLGLSIRKNEEQRREVRIRTVQVVQAEQLHGGEVVGAALSADCPGRM